MIFDVNHIREVMGIKLWSPPIIVGISSFNESIWALRNFNKDGSILISEGLYDGATWIHASMTRKKRVPSYEDLKRLHKAVFGDKWAYFVFAPPSEHVNIHDYALHLWGRADGKPALPDFTRGLGGI